VLELSGNTIYRIAIVGAGSLAGKELSDALSESPLATSSFTLLDEDQVTGQVAAAGDEISFIQKIDSSSFEGMDIVFFASDREVAAKYWRAAHQAGAGIVDMTAALEQIEGALVRSPWVAAQHQVQALADPPLDLETSILVSAHPASVMLAFIAARIAAQFQIASLSVTLLEPASQYGRAAMDELHQQTVSLLSFQSLPRELYDAQAAFNLLSSLGESAKIRLAETEALVARQYHTLQGTSPQLLLQLIHAPVFHGYVASVFLELTQSATAEELELGLLGDHIDIVSHESDPPSNLSATGQEDIMVQVVAATSNGLSKRFKLLLAADNLKLAAANAIACARELAQLRPRGKVQ
jgi:aspartate-semialdehyde dehydrogenase